MEGHHGAMQISTETSTWLLRPRTFLTMHDAEAGPTRNELRQVAKAAASSRRFERNPNPHWTLIGRREPDGPHICGTWMNNLWT